MGWYILASIGCLILGIIFLYNGFEKDDLNDFYLILGAVFISSFIFLQMEALDMHRHTITAEQYLLNPQDYQVDKVYRDSVIIEYKVSKKE